MDLNKVTYGEMLDFFNNIKPSDKVDIYVAYQTMKDELEIRKKILSMFPASENRDYDLNFIDPEKREAIVAIKENKKVIAYIPYLASSGVALKMYTNYDEALVGLLCFKHCGNSTDIPDKYICKMIDIPVTNYHNVVQQFDNTKQNNDGGKTDDKQ